MNSRFVALAISLLTAPSVALADSDLLVASKDAPVYRLSNFRTEADRFGSQVMLFDFTRTRQGSNDMTVRVRGKSSRGYVSISASISSYVDSGTMQMKSLFGSRTNQQLDLEVFLVQSHSWGDEKTRYAVVSNAVRLGNPGPTIEPRAWTAEEEKAYENYKRIMADPKAHKPHKSYPVSIDVPADSQFLPEAAKVTSGTRLEACFQKKWHPLTTLSENGDGSVNVRWDTFGAKYDCSMTRDELIIKKAFLVKAPTGASPVTLSHADARKRGLVKEPPPTSKPLKSYPVSIPVPDHSQFVPNNAKLKPGTKLQACYAGKWNPITHLAHNADGTLTVRWDDYGPTFDCRMARNELIIRQTVLRGMPESAADPYAPSSEPAPVPVVAKPRKSYPVSIPVPPHSVFVPQDAKLKPGTKLQACYANKWNPITHLSHNDDGTLNVRWDDYGSAYDCSMLRKELIIRKTVLTRLQKPASDASTPSSEPPAFRTWTDATGKFQVRARLLRKSDTTATLLTEKGRELKVPISKLSGADQAFLSSPAGAR